MYDHGDQARIRKEGFSLLDIRGYLQSQGYKADGFVLPIDKLFEEGLPAIVLLNDRGYRHFVVVKGLRGGRVLVGDRSEEHTSELQSLMRISYAVFCLKK